MVASSPQPTIPAAATAGAFAQVVGLTERVIAGRKADGRLPKLPSGAIDLHAIIRAGMAEFARRRGTNGGPDVDPAAAFDTALRLGASVASHLAAEKLQGSASAADQTALAKTIHEEACDMFGIASMEHDPHAEN